MRAIVFKELRENLRWTLLLMLGLAAALAFGVHSDGKTSGVSLISTLTAIVTAVAFPVVGLTLGLVQVLQDRRRGRWGFVVHRPLSRSMIFAAKVVAGIVLYTVAGGVPLMVTIAWVATPGHVSGPFDWRMALPPLADLLCGGHVVRDRVVRRRAAGAVGRHPAHADRADADRRELRLDRVVPPLAGAAVGGGGDRRGLAGGMGGVRRQ